MYLNDNIEKPIENIINQTIFSEIQLVIMTENCNDLCLNYESKFDNIIYAPNTDKKEKLKTGYNYSEGIYLFFMNDDDYFDLDLFSSVKTFINNSNAEIILLNHILNNLKEYEIKKK